MSTTEQAVRIETGAYGIDAVHSQVGFEVKHLGISTFRGSFKASPARSTSVEKASRRSWAPSRSPASRFRGASTGHLLSPDFFDAEANPEGSFRSTSIEQVDGENYKVTGDLTLRGTTNPVVLDVEVEGAGIGMDGSSVLSLKADGIVNRNDYGISSGRSPRQRRRRCRREGPHRPHGRSSQGGSVIMQVLVTHGSLRSTRSRPGWPVPPLHKRRKASS